MKKILSITFIFALALSTFAQVDRTVRPEAGESRVPQIGQPESFVLDNGLKVFVVQNSKLPRVSMSLVLNAGPEFEGDKAGYLSMTGELMRAGTTNRSKAELDEEVDFMGASLSVSAQSVYASSLSKYTEDMMAIMADVVLNPAFNADEFEKIKKQMLSGLESNKDDAGTINSQVYSALIYGKDNAMGEFVTEESVNMISVDDCKAYYEKTWKPNIGYLAIVGDIKAKKAKKMIEAAFGAWASGEVKKYEMETPELPAKTYVALVNRDASVQSVVKIGNRIVLKPGAADIAAMSVANQILGGGMNGRLFTNIREDKAYTYGAYSGYGTSEYVSSFAASAEVRNNVTDSAVTEFLYEINRMRTEDVTERELSLAKSGLSGSFGRSLESASTIANFAINIDRYGLPADYYQNYLTRLEAVTIEDVKRVSNEYMNLDNLTICITGKASEVGNLAQFGEVKYYDMYAEPAAAPMSPAPEGLTANKVVENYITAVGGAEAIAKIKSIDTKYAVTIPGMPMSLEMRLSKDLAKGYYFMGMSMNGQVMQSTTYNGKVGKQTAQGQTVELEGEELEKTATDAKTLVDEMAYLTEAYTIELAGMKNFEGEDVYVVEVKDAAGKSSTDFFSVASGLKVASMSSEEGPQGSVSVIERITEYKEVSGVKVPAKISQSMGAQTFNLEISEVVVNKKFDTALLK